MPASSTFTDNNVKSALVVVYNGGDVRLTEYIIENNGIQDVWLKFYEPTDPTDPINTTPTGATPTFELKLYAGEHIELSSPSILTIDDDGIWKFHGAITMRAVTRPDDLSNASPTVGLVVRLQLTP